jgi:rubrerythrin
MIIIAHLSSRVIQVTTLVLLSGLFVSRLALAEECCSIAASNEQPRVYRQLLRSIQDGSGLPPEQRDVLQQLMNAPEMDHLRSVLELYLTRDRRLSDDDFETLKELLAITTQLSDLEREKSEAPGPTMNEQAPKEEPAPPLAPRPSPGDMLYHSIPPLKPL